MIDKKEDFEVLPSNNQNSLFGYDEYFSLFTELYSNNSLPNVSLIEGQKGIGKSTFIYHFANFILSKNEKDQYFYEKKSINKHSQCYHLISQNTHPNFYHINKRNDQKNIGIDQIRHLSLFLNKTSYQNNLKIVLIDDVEFLNINSSNALLKILEEIRENTFFFIICSNLSKLRSTIKSRSIMFRVNFNYLKKKNIFEKLLNCYQVNEEYKNLSEYLFFDTPGNFLKYFTLINKNNNVKDELINLISLYIKKYQKEKDNEYIYFLSLFIEMFYNYLISNELNSHHLFNNKNQILNKLNLLQKYNLDDNNVFLFIKNTLVNEKK